MGNSPVDIAVIAAPAADSFGNSTGVLGQSACGPPALPWPMPNMLTM
ncbi:MAG: hypothetical protein R2867_03530 [Caldilineaceae bacterium]